VHWEGAARDLPADYVPRVPGPSSKAAAFVVAASVVALAGCGGGSPSPQGDASPALKPSGASAQAVQYHCVAGRRDTITVSLPDPRRLADVLNPINVCEFDGGLADVVLTVQCAQGAAASPVRIVAVDGKVPPSAAQRLCS
jgi:hypothetical protein